METILKYFSGITVQQKEQFQLMMKLYPEWNLKINVISRVDIEFLSVRHILHSLAIAKLGLINNSSKVLDVGTGGGFPGIPLAVMYPEKHFTLIDSIGKKITVVKNIAEQLGLKNVEALQTKSTLYKFKFDTIVSRAVTAFPNFVSQTIHNLQKNENSKIVYLKGGDFAEEIAPFANKSIIYNISDIFPNIEFFETKKVIEYAPFSRGAQNF